MKKLEYCVVRGDRSGVFAGEVESKNGQDIILRNVRRLWYWNGACSISEIAKYGVKYPDDCKFTVTLDKIEILDAIEIIPCTKEAENCIKGVKEWKKN